MSKSKPEMYDRSFKVDLRILSLENIPLTGVSVFCVWKMLKKDEGKPSRGETVAAAVIDNSVSWKDDAFAFLVRIASSKYDRLKLLPCILRISVRRKRRLKDDFQKIGKRDIDLSKYAGAGLLKPTFLLEECLMNSTLKIEINISQRYGDLIYKRPVSNQALINSVLDFMRDESEGGGDNDELGSSELNRSSAGPSDSAAAQTTKDKEIMDSLNLKAKQKADLQNFIEKRRFRESIPEEIVSSRFDAKQAVDDLITSMKKSVKMGDSVRGQQELDLDELMSSRKNKNSLGPALGQAVNQDASFR